MDELFQRFVAEAVARTDSLQAKLVKVPDDERLWHYTSARSLKKAWYNELAFSTPSLTNPLILDSQGVAINRTASESRFVFQSWRIVMSYYTVYHVHRALCDFLGTPYRAQEHESPLRAFKATKLQPALEVLLKFPFNLRYGFDTSTGSYAKQIGTFKSHLSYVYASHPRPPHYFFANVVSRVIARFRQRWRACPSGGKGSYT